MRHLICLLLAVPALAQDTRQSPAERGWTDAAVRRLLHREAARALEEPNAVGFSVAVGFGDRVVYAGGYGLAEKEHGVPVGPETMFRIGSVTKQFTAALMMRRVEQGRIGLDDPIGPLLPELDLQGHTVTVRQLLNHTSGIKSYTDLGQEWMRIVSLELSHEELIDLFEDEPFDFAPGEGWHYDNSGYYLLGMLLERLERPGERVRARDGYRNLVERELFEPLGLERTHHDSNSKLFEDRAQGYGVMLSLQNDRLIGMNQPGGAGALISTAGDLVRWQQALVGGRVVSGASYTAMTTPTGAAAERGYGFGLIVSEADGLRMVHHGGGIFGFNSILSYFPDRVLHVAVISNSEGASAGGLGKRLTQALLGEAPDEEPLEPDPAFESPRLGRLAAELARDPGALEDFWREVEGHAPLVEPGPGDGWATVTYLWRDGEAQRVWMIGGQDVGREKPLARLAGSDLWYRTEELPSAARFTYAFQPDLPLRQPETMDEVVAFYQANPPRPDPLNPRRFAAQSYLELDDAPPQPWVAFRAEVARGALATLEVAGRTVHVYTPPGYGDSRAECDLLVVLDGEVHGGADGALVPTPTLLDNLAAQGRIGPLVALLVSNGSGSERFANLGCSEEFAAFLAGELVPWARARYRVKADPRRAVLAGSSLGGLMSTFTALRHPQVFGNVISQSGSYWWTRDSAAAMAGREPMSSGWLIEETLRLEPRPVRVWMEVGLFEGAGAMLGPNRHLRDVLRLKGNQVIYSEFVGGHDYLHWRGSLGRALVDLLGSAPPPPPLSEPGRDGYLSGGPIQDPSAPPTPRCHASTIVELADGALLAAWFGGRREGHDDVGIWSSRSQDGGRTWSTCTRVVTGAEDEERDFPCWNPVLFQEPQGALLLFYKVGPSPRQWWGGQVTSHDGGRSWSAPRRLGSDARLGAGNPALIGPVRNKPLRLADGTLLCASSSEHDGWRVHFERHAQDGTVELIGPIEGGGLAAIQPTLLTHPGGRLQALCRTREGVVAQTWSADGGRTWSALRATELPNPNAALDGITLADGRHLLVYNHTTGGLPAHGDASAQGRNMLNVALSSDGERWTPVLTLEREVAPGGYSYPAVIQTRDGRVHVTYTWRRQAIKHVVLEPAGLPPPR